MHLSLTAAGLRPALREGAAGAAGRYAVGTMTTVFSLAVIIVSFIAIYFVQTRRAGRARSIQARYGSKSDS